MAEFPTKDRVPTPACPRCSQPPRARGAEIIEWSARKERSSTVVRWGSVSTVEISTFRPTLAPSSRIQTGVARLA